MSFLWPSENVSLPWSELLRKQAHCRHGRIALLKGKEWPDKLTWTRTHACHSQINTFPVVVFSRIRLFIFTIFSTMSLVGETGWEGQTDGWEFGCICSSCTVIRATIWSVKWAGHVAHREIRSACKVFVETFETKRLLGNLCVMAG